MVTCSTSRTLGTKFLYLDPRLSIQPCVGHTGQPRRLTNLFRSTHEPHSLGVPFGIRIENVSKRGGGGGAFIQEQPGLLDDELSGKPTLPCNKRFRVGEWLSHDGGLRPFGWLME